MNRLNDNKSFVKIEHIEFFIQQKHFEIEMMKEDTQIAYKAGAFDAYNCMLLYLNSLITAGKTISLKEGCYEIKPKIFLSARKGGFLRRKRKND